jgi:hypothetical protein
LSTQQLDVNQTILIVVGSEIKPEEKDRPLAYKLQQQIQRAPAYGKVPFRKCVVISDLLFENDIIIQVCPTIAIGGPGVNMAAARFAEKLPVYLNKDNRYFVQYDKSPKNNRVAIWGMDQETTNEAIDEFIKSGLLEEYLGRIWN